MAENHARRWRRGGAAGGVPESNSNRTIGRVFTFLMAVALLGAIVWFLLPVQQPRNWVVTFAAESPDEWTLAIPFATNDSTLWIPESTEPRHLTVTDLSDPGKIVHGIEALTKKPPTDKDRLVVYLVGYGINDQESGPQIVIGERGKENRLPARKLLKSLIGLPFKSILVVFDCSRTLECPRLGWEYSGTFPKGLETVVETFNGSSEAEVRNAERLWVMSASDNRQLGLVLQDKKRSLFGWAWHESMSATANVPKKRSKTVELKDLFERLRENTGVTNEKSLPLLYRGGHRGLVSQADVAKVSQVVWYGDVAKIEPAKEASPEAAAKKKDLIDQIKLAKREELPAVMDRNGLVPELRFLWSVWERIEKIESGQVKIKDIPDDSIEQWVSPLVYAPHVWRRLKWQLVADECALLANQHPKFSADSYQNKLQKLETWPKDQPAFTSGTVFDQLDTAWYHFAKYKFEHLRRASNEEKQKELNAALRNYAEALFILPELSAIENRLVSVTNAKPFSRAENVGLVKCARLLAGFYQKAFEISGAKSVEQQVADVIADGKKLKEWKDKALNEWNEFGNVAADELMADKYARSNWVTLDLLLTSSLWSCEQRQKWRMAQSFLTQSREAGEPRFSELPVLPNHSSLAELTKIDDKLAPFPAQPDNFQNWYKSVAAKANDIADKTARNESKAHFLAALSDPRDCDDFISPYAIWFETKLEPEAQPEYFRLELISAEAIAKPDAKPEPVKPVLTAIDLDSSPVATGKFKFLVSWKRSRDGKPGEIRKVMLKAKFDQSWILADQKREVAFKGDEPVTKDDYLQKAVEWDVAMVNGKERTKSDDTSVNDLNIAIEFDGKFFEEQNRLRTTEPKLLVESGKDSVQSQIKPRNHRAVSLSLKQRDWELTKRKSADAEILEAPLLAGRDTPLEWLVINESPVGVAVKAELWAIKRSEEWRSPWGRISSDYVIERRGNPRLTEKPLAVHEMASLGVGEEQMIAWAAPPPAAVKEQQAVDVTHGLFCRLTVDQRTTREFFVELVPRPPRKWLQASGNLSPADSGSIFDVSVARQNDWPWRAYRSLDLSKLRATLSIPKDWEAVGGLSTEIPEQGSGQIRTQFLPKAGKNDQLIFLDVDGWHRAFRWGVKVNPGAQGKQSISETYRLNFTKSRFTMVEPKYDKTFDVPLDNSKTNPLNFQFVKQKSNAPARLYVSFEADALENFFSTAVDGCGELRIEQTFGNLDSPKTLYRRRADRLFTTTGKFDAEDSGKFVLNSNVSDFDDILLDGVELGESGDRLVTLRASFYAAGAQSPSQADGKNEVQLLFDGRPPTIEEDGVRQDPMSADLLVRLNVSDGQDDNPGSGVKEVKCWFRPLFPKRPLSAEELLMPAIFHELKIGEDLPEFRIPTKDIPPALKAMPHDLLVRATDRVGLEKEFHYTVSKIANPTVAGVANPAGGNEPGVGVIKGKLLFPTGKEAEGFTIRLTQPGKESEKTTNLKGEFRFEKLDLGVECSLTVEPRTVNSKEYGLSAPSRLMPGSSNSVREAQIRLKDLSQPK